MKLKIKKSDTASAEMFAERLRCQIADFPTYLHSNWDSIEASLCDYLDDHGDNFEIENEFSKEWLAEYGGVYTSILSRLMIDYPDIPVGFL